jgi:CspA family cold shock protein
MSMTTAEPEQIKDAQGTVKWFDPKKGFGFIIGPSGQDIFVHYTKIDGEGFRVLKDGSTVVYDANLTDKGWHATRVVRTGPLDVQVPPRRGYARSPRR